MPKPCPNLSDTSGWTLAFPIPPANLHELGKTASYESTDVRRTLARTYVDLQMLDLNAQRQLSNEAVGNEPGSDGPVAKLLWSMAAQSLGRAWTDVLGADALTGEEAEALVVYFRELTTSIYGGSAQIQRNQLAQRFMGMPRG